MTPAQRVIADYFRDGMKAAEIGRKLGKSRQWIHYVLAGLFAQGLLKASQRIEGRCCVCKRLVAWDVAKTRMAHFAPAKLPKRFLCDLCTENDYFRCGSCLKVVKRSGMGSAAKKRKAARGGECRLCFNRRMRDYYRKRALAKVVEMRNN